MLVRWQPHDIVQSAINKTSAAIAGTLPLLQWCSLLAPTQAQAAAATATLDVKIASAYLRAIYTAVQDLQVRTVCFAFAVPVTGTHCILALLLASNILLLAVCAGGIRRGVPALQLQVAPA